MATQRALRFDTIDDLIAEVRRLREGGYERAGSWSLEQACWHLNLIMRFMMRPGQRVPSTPEQDARRPMVDHILATGQVPAGITAPDAVVPPADAPASVVDDFIATHERLKTFAGPFATHRLFGNLPDAEVVRLHLAHGARHLSFLVPT